MLTVSFLFFFFSLQKYSAQSLCGHKVTCVAAFLVPEVAVYTAVFVDMTSQLLAMYDVKNCSGTISPTSNTANATTEKKPIGAIIGGVVGGIVIVVVIAGYFIYQKRKSKTSVNNTLSQKLEEHELDDSHLSQKTQIMLPQNLSPPPMPQAPEFQQFVFSTHPKPNVNLYGQQQQQQTVPSVWNPQPFVAPTAE